MNGGGRGWETAGTMRWNVEGADLGQWWIQVGVNTGLVTQDRLHRSNTQLQTRLILRFRWPPTLTSIETVAVATLLKIYSPEFDDKKALTIVVSGFCIDI